MRRLDIHRILTAHTRKQERRRAADAERRREDQELRQWVDSLTGAVNRLIEAAEPTPAPKPSRITMEGVAHPLPVSESPDVVDNAIAWLIYSTNHEHGPTVRYGTATQ